MVKRQNQIPDFHILDRCVSNQTKDHRISDDAIGARASDAASDAYRPIGASLQREPFLDGGPLRVEAKPGEHVALVVGAGEVPGPFRETVRQVLAVTGDDDLVVRVSAQMPNRKPLRRDHGFAMPWRHEKHQPRGESEADLLRKLFQGRANLAVNPSGLIPGEGPANIGEEVISASPRKLSEDLILCRKSIRPSRRAPRVV